jgi:hypothetical protein
MSHLRKQSYLLQIGVPKMNTENTCPVCGYDIQAPPKNYRICQSCGTEFGVSDLNTSVAELREAWMKTGPKWWGDAATKPADWDAITQMANAGIVVKRPAASEPSAVSTATGSSTIGGRGWRGWAVSGSGQPGDISRVVVCD